MQVFRAIASLATISERVSSIATTMQGVCTDICEGPEGLEPYILSLLDRSSASMAVQESRTACCEFRCEILRLDGVIRARLQTRSGCLLQILRDKPPIVCCG